MPGLTPDAVLPDVWLGPHPRDDADVEAIAAVGVTAVLSLQTDDDLREHGVDLAVLDGAYARRGIRHERFPIRDFDQADLLAKLAAAVDRLHRLRAKGHRVYVHCTAGMGRSPAVVVGELCLHGGLSPDAALDRVRACRPAAAPDVDTVRRAVTAEKAPRRPSRSPDRQRRAPP